MQLERYVVKYQSQIEEALELSYYGLSLDDSDLSLVVTTRNILRRFFPYALVNRGTGIALSVFRSTGEDCSTGIHSLMFAFQDSETGCVDPFSFLQQIYSDKWTEIIESASLFSLEVGGLAAHLTYCICLHYKEEKKDGEDSRSRILQGVSLLNKEGEVLKSIKAET